MKNTVNEKPVGIRVEESISKLGIEFLSKSKEESIIITIFQIQRSWLQSLLSLPCIREKTNFHNE